MTKGELIGTVLLKASGGRPTTDMDVREYDVRSLLAPAINYALDATYNINIKTEGDRDFPTEFYGSFEGVPIVRTGKRPSFTLEKGTVPLKGNAGIRTVYDDCDNFYAPLTDSDMATVNYWSGISTGTKWYRRKQMDVELYNVNPLAETINYQAITDINQIEDTDELPIQAGQDPLVIDLLVGWITGQTEKPFDRKINARDDI